MTTLLAQPLSPANQHELLKLIERPELRQQLPISAPMMWAKQQALADHLSLSQAPPHLGLSLINIDGDFVGVCGLAIIEELGVRPQLICALEARLDERKLLITRILGWLIAQLRQESDRVGRIDAAFFADDQALLSAAQHLGMCCVGQCPGPDIFAFKLYTLALTDQAHASLLTLQREQTHTLHIKRGWDGLPVASEDEATLTANFSPSGLTIKLEAPFYGDPAPPSAPGSTPKLWEHEVVEVFFLGQDERYLELEFGPHGHYLALALMGRRKALTDKLRLSYQSTINWRRWEAKAQIPLTWLPTGLNRINAYAIHGSGDSRRYLSSFGAPTPGPDFHHLESFAHIIP